MSDTPEGAPTPEMEIPDDADEDEFSGDEISGVTPPNAEEGKEAPEAR